MEEAVEETFSGIVFFNLSSLGVQTTDLSKSKEGDLDQPDLQQEWKKRWWKLSGIVLFESSFFRRTENGDLD